MNERTVRDEWERFVGNGDRPLKVRSTVAGSWNRSRTHSVDVASRGAPVLSEAALYRRRTDNTLLLASARKAMEKAGQIIAEASSMLILTDGSGHIIKSIGDGRTIDAGRDVHLQDGGCWSEDKIGTNAIGTAMAARSPVQIHAAEHFCEKVQRWTCAAAPIFHPLDRELLGIVDISGPPKTFSSQNLALVVSIASNMENLMLQAVNHQHSRLMAHIQDRHRKWERHDIIAIDRRGGIVHCSATGLKKLAQHREGGSHLDDLSHLRSVPFESWPDDCVMRIAGAEALLIRDGEEELGAVIVLPRSTSAAPSKHFKSRKDAAHKAGRGTSTVDDGAIRLPSAARPSASEKPTENFVADDPAVKHVCNNVAAAARLRIPILICGQTGTGKEELARHAHVSSGRKGAFVPVNCSALPEGLIEAELFGYADGAFTGACKGGSKGLGKEADGGTLFLDEIGEMAFNLQSVLLRFLDDFHVRPVGGKMSKVDVLVVSATNTDLGLAVTSRRFRTDLLYRLNTLQVTLPALAERNDFSEILHFLLKRIDPQIKVTEPAIAALSGYSWPGNIRELRGVLVRLSMMASSAGHLINERLVKGLGLKTSGKAESNEGSLRDLQRARLLAVYKETRGNISETARRLNVCRNTVYRALGKADGE